MKAVIAVPQCSLEKRLALEKAGCVFLEEGGELVSMTLPEGWSIKQDERDEALGERYIFDELGRLRIFVQEEKRNGIDLSFLKVIPFYDARIEGERQGWSQAVVFQTWNEEIVFRSEKLPGGHSSEIRQVRDQAIKWLKENYPDWEDLSAYWG